MIARMLEMILDGLGLGGSFLFQVTTHTEGYEFNVKSYLESSNPIGAFEMHAIPMHVVLAIIQRSGGKLREVMPDCWTGRYGSFTFFGTKGEAREQAG
jgi:hypothetical protein